MRTQFYLVDRRLFWHSHSSLPFSLMMNLLLLFLRFLLVFWLLIAHGYLLSTVKNYSK